MRQRLLLCFPNDGCNYYTTLALVALFLVNELALFYLKSLFWIPSTHWIILVRTCIHAALGSYAIEQLYGLTKRQLNMPFGLFL